MMTEDKEKWIQQILDSNLQFEEEQYSSSDIDDMEAYKQVYSVLKKEPKEGLSYAFKANLFERIKLEKRRANDFKLYLISGIVIFIGLVTISFATYLFADIFIKYFIVLREIISFMVVVIISLILSQFFEKKQRYN